MLKIFFVTFVSVLLFAYGAVISAQETNLKLATYNLGLAHGFVNLADQRLEQQVIVLPKIDTDIFCMQEAWNKKDRKKIARAMATKFPYSIVPEIVRTKAEHAPVCKISDLFGQGPDGEPKIVTCFQTKCKGLSGQAFTSCVINDCRTSLDNLKQEKRQCAQALMAQVGKNPTISMLRLISPFKKVDMFTYKGSNGLMLFSKFPFIKQGLIQMGNISTLSRRDFLYAEIQTNSGNWFVGCTHPSANLSASAPYTGTFSGWEEENAAQVNFIHAQVEKLAMNLPVAILGDFNFSPTFAEQNISGDMEKNYWEFLNLGYLDPIALPQFRACSYCNSNTLNKPTDASNLIDHIFLRGVAEDRVIKAAVFMQEKKLVKSDKKWLYTNLSDHYGVSLELKN